MPMDLTELFGLVRAGEGPHVEFKREFPPQVHKLAKTLAAFANSGGGVLLLGVDEDSGAPLGLANPNKGMDRLSGIARSLSPALVAEIDKVHVGETSAVVYARVPSAAPCLYEGTIFVRVGATSVQAEADDVKALLGRPSEPRVTPPAQPAAQFTPPPVRGFRGRERELARLRALLDSDGPVVVVIEGIGGVGKSALAARFAALVQAEGHPSFWLDCRPDTSLESVTVGLATFARSQNRPSLSEVLENGTIPFDERVAAISASLADEPYVLFFDEYDKVADPLANRLLKRIAERSQRIRICLLCRRRPWLASAMSPRLLREERLRVGLDLSATSAFLGDCGLRCSHDEARGIWTLTGEGHPKAIEVFAARARQYPVVDLLSSLPVFREEFSREWLAPLLDELPDAQRQLALDLSVFDRAIPLAALDELCPDKETEGLTSGLVDRFILDRVAGESLRMHPLIQEFCQALIGDIHAKHKRAADYYSARVVAGSHEDEPHDDDIENLTAAWSHFVRAQDTIGAARMLDRLRPALMNRGQYQQILFLIEHTPTAPEKRPWYEIDRARVLALWGEVDKAIAMLGLLVGSSDTRVAREAALVLASVHNERGAPREAGRLLAERHSWFARDISPLARRRFLHRLVDVHLQLGEHAEALSWASQLVESCEVDGDEIGGAISLRQMATVLRAQGHLDAALSLCQVSHLLLSSRGRIREAAITERLLAILQGDRGEHGKAQAALEHALQVFTDMHDTRNAQHCRAALAALDVGQPRPPRPWPPQATD